MKGDSMKEYLWTFIVLGSILLCLTLLPLVVVIVFLLGLGFTSYLISKYLIKKDQPKGGKHGQEDIRKSNTRRTFK